MLVYKPPFPLRKHYCHEWRQFWGLQSSGSEIVGVGRCKSRGDAWVTGYRISSDDFRYAIKTCKRARASLALNWMAWNCSPRLKLWCFSFRCSLCLLADDIIVFRHIHSLHMYSFDLMTRILPDYKFINDLIQEKGGPNEHFVIFWSWSSWRRQILLLQKSINSLYRIVVSFVTGL